MRRNTILYISLLILSCNLYSQNDSKINAYTVSGVLTNSSENKLLSYVNIALLSAKDNSFVKSAITNEKGEFSIKNIENGNYILRIATISYHIKNIKIHLTKDTSITILLKKNDSEIDEVTINGTKVLYKLETDKRIYLTANDESIQNTFAEDALENAPGVYIDIDGNVIIRGKPASIWFNGKPSKKDNEDLKAYLKLLPAPRIEKIEVITNPSARYTATNTNSIVNIVLKKKVYENSLFALGLILNTGYTYGLWATVYITKKKFDFNIYIFGANSLNFYNNYDKSFNFANQDTSFYSEYSDKATLERTAGRLFSEFTYHISNKTNVNISTYYYNYLYANSFETDIIRRYDNPYLMKSNRIYNRKGYYFNTTLNLNHNFDKEGHNIDFEVKAYKGIYNISYYKQESDKLNSNDFYQQSTPLKESYYVSILTNYQYPIKERHLFSAGFHFYPLNSETYINFVDTSSNLNNIWNRNLILSNKYTSKTPSFEIYSSFSGGIASLKYKFGLRYEHSIYDLKQTVPVYKILKIYSNLYPSIHLSYETKLKHSFSLSYSKRVNTPIYNLNPYIDRTNNDYISSGNPNLDFATTNSYEFTYFKRFNKINITTSIYQRNTKNDIIKVSEPIYDDYYKQTVVLQTYANCADSKFTGTEISLSSSPIKNLKLRLYTNTYYQNLNGSYNNLPLADENFIYSAKFTVSYKFFNKFTFNITPYYKSDIADIFHSTKAIFYTNARLKFDLRNKRLSIDIKAKDIFGTRERISEYYLDNFYHYSEKDYNFQNVRFVVIFRIGNSKFDRQAKINKLAR